MNCRKMPSDTDLYEQITFVSVTSNDIVTFDNKEPKVVLIDIFKPILKIENCTWLEEI